MRVQNTMARLASLFIGVGAVLAGAPALATTYYVSGAGNDSHNGLTEATAFRSLQRAANLTKPGDTVSVLNGTYTDNGIGENILWIRVSGTAAKPITFSAAPGQTPLIKASTNPNVMIGIYISASYINFSGFEVIGQARNVTLAQATSVAQKEITAYQNSVTAHKKNPATPLVLPSDTATNQNCIYISHTTHVNITNNLVHDCSASGITVDTSDYFRIESNVVFNTSWWSVHDTSGINIHGMLNSDTLNGYKNYIVNNISHDNANTQPFYILSASGAPSDGNGIIIDTNQATSDGKNYYGRTLVMGNIVYNNGGTGMHCYLSWHIDFINNTAYHNNFCPVQGSTCGNINAGEIIANRSGDVNIYNNIMYAPAGKNVYRSYENIRTSEDYNVFYNAGGTVVLGNYQINTHDILADPNFYDLTQVTNVSTFSDVDQYDRIHPTQPITDLGLTATSRARNAGTTHLDNGIIIYPTAINGNLDSKIDIGAVSGITQ